MTAFFRKQKPIKTHTFVRLRIDTMSQSCPGFRAVEGATCVVSRGRRFVLPLRTTYDRKQTTDGIDPVRY